MTNFLNFAILRLHIGMLTLYYKYFIALFLITTHIGCATNQQSSLSRSTSCRFSKAEIKEKPRAALTEKSRTLLKTNSVKSWSFAVLVYQGTK